MRSSTVAEWGWRDQTALRTAYSSISGAGGRSCEGIGIPGTGGAGWRAESAACVLGSFTTASRALVKSFMALPYCTPDAKRIARSSRRGTEFSSTFCVSGRGATSDVRYEHPGPRAIAPPLVQKH